jgi:hypothetical protein
MSDRKELSLRILLGQFGYSVEGKLNHRREHFTFEAILEDFRPTDPALHHLGLIIRGADVKGQENLSAESVGLRAIAQGFALSGISDEVRLEREFPIYDALLKMAYYLLLCRSFRRLPPPEER